MNPFSVIRDKVLSSSVVYSAAQKSISTKAGRGRYVEALAVQSGMRVLEVGCGTGDLIAKIPPVDYVGFDPSSVYIAAATEAHGEHGRFFVSGIDEIDADELGEFDVVAAKGVLHHLDDDQVVAVAELASRVLELDGRLVTMDPTRVPEQHPIARRLVDADRGQFVRTPDDYRRLLETHLEVHRVDVRSDVLRVPYNHAFITARPRIAS